MIMAQRKDIDAMRRSRDVDGLILALSDPEEIVRQTAAEALGLVGDERAIEPLARLKFLDPDAGVRRAASLAHTQVAARLAGQRAVGGLK
ncbi:HEAT repeat-containing protein [Methanoculleus thermophilus]|uniref:HEAT repeat-containing protein n=2 Tax=Methanomicrobiaceae TaxID=2194 RepID=A0A1G8X0K1_9EURY|nr:HEAT repeat-containing protein [Methanoculleus thermophilus]